MTKKQSQPQQTEIAAPLNDLKHYFIGLIALSIPFWILGQVVQPDDIPINLPVSSLMAITPMIVTLFLVHREQGNNGVREFVKTCL